MAAGFPPGFPGATSSAEDAKNGLSMLPMMLHGIPHGAAIPQHAMLSVGMMAHAAPPAKAGQSESTSPTSSTTEKEPSPAEKDKSKEEAPGEGSKKATTTAAAPIVEQTAIITSSRGHIGAAHIGTSTSSHLTFNPFLIPGMSHGLLYPHMFLPHGGIMALPAMPPGATDGQPGSPTKRRRKKDEDKTGDDELKAAASSQRQPDCQSPPPPLPATTSSEQQEATESQDSQGHTEEATEEEDKQQEAAEEQRQASGEEG